MLNVTVVLLGGGFASTALGPLEVFYAAGTLWRELTGKTPEPFFSVSTATLDGGPVRVPYGVSLDAHRSIDEIERTDIIVVPTSGLEFEARLVENSKLLPWLVKHHARGAYVAGVCLGSAYLAEAGLLDDRQATTHWALHEPLAKRYPRVRWRPDMLVTEESRVLCSGGVYAANDVSLYLVEKLCGHEVAVQTAKSLLLDMPRLTQTSYAVLPLSPEHEDSRIRDVESYLQTHHAENVSMEALAERFGMSARTFLRRFKAATHRMPGAYQQSVRIEAAKTLLEHERLPVQSVASKVGYDDVAYFRTLFKRETGMTPAEYRAHFATLAVRQADGESLRK